MSDRAAKWKQEFSKTQATMEKVRSDLQQWEQLAGQTGTGFERARQGAEIRAKVMQLKLDSERLQRELDALNDQSQEVKGKLRDDLGKALVALQELQRRAKGSPGTSQTVTPSPASSASSWETVSLSGSFTCLNGDDKSHAGAELQPVSQRAMMEQQQKRLRDMDEQASHLGGSVNNLQHVSNMILGEIRSQNSMLDGLNQDTDRVQGRLGRAQTLLERFSRADRNRWLICCTLLLLVALVALLIFVLSM